MSFETAAPLPSSSLQQPRVTALLVDRRDEVRQTHTPACLHSRRPQFLCLAPACVGWRVHRAPAVCCALPCLLQVCAVTLSQNDAFESVAITPCSVPSSPPPPVVEVAASRCADTGRRYAVLCVLNGINGSSSSSSSSSSSKSTKSSSGDLVRHSASLQEGAWVCRDHQRVSAGGCCVYAATADSFWGGIDFNCVFLVSDDSGSSIRLHLKHSLGQRAPKLVEACCSAGYAVSVTQGHPPHCIIRVTVLRSEPAPAPLHAHAAPSLLSLPVKLLPPPQHVPPPPSSPPSGGGTSAGESSFLSFVSRSITINLINNTLGAFELLAVRVFEGVSLAPAPSYLSPSSSVALQFNSDHVSGGVACGMEVQGVDTKAFRLKVSVENPLIGRSVVSALASVDCGVEVECIDGTHCVVSCRVSPSAVAPAVAEATATPPDNQAVSSLYPPLRISSYCCCSPLETVPPHATPSTLAAAVAAAGRPDILFLQGCSADHVHCLSSSLGVSLSPSSPLLSPPPIPSSASPQHVPGATAKMLASGGHVIISLADTAGLRQETACTWEGQNKHASCSAFAVPHASSSAADVWLVSVNLTSFEIDLGKSMDATHTETLHSMCQWLHGLLSARPLPIIMAGFFGIPGEDPASSSSSSLFECGDFSQLKSLLAAISPVSQVLDVFRVCNQSNEAGLTWDYMQNSTIESFERLFARDSFVFILNPLTAGSESANCVPVACFVKPLGATPATRLSPHFGLSAIVKVQGGTS